MQKKHVLIVEDENVVALYIQQQLTSLGYAAPAIANTGKDAIRLAEQTRPDLVLMDIQLRGEMDGVEAAKQIRSRLDLPVVFLTAYADDDTLRRAKISEPFGYLLKPVRDRELQSAVEMGLYKHQMERRLKESERWLSATLNSIGDAVIAADAQGCIQFINPRAEDLSGWQQEQALGKDLEQVFRIIDGETHAPRESLFAQVLREGTPLHSKNDTLLIAQDGTQIPIGSSAAAIKDEKGEIVGVVLAFHDVTQRVKAEKALQQRAEELSALNAVSAAAVSSLELDVVLHQILQSTCQALNAAEGSIMLRERDSGDLFFAVSLTEKTRGLRQVRLAPGQGIAGWAVERGEPVRVDDVSQDPRWHPEVDAVIGFETRSLLCAPLKHRGEITGVIEIVNKRKGEFNQDDMSLLVAVASIAAAALENARLFASSQARVRELALLSEIGLAVTSTLEQDKVIQVALSLTQRLFQADGIFLLQFDPQTDVLSYFRALTKMKFQEISMHLSSGEGIANWALERRRAVLLRDAQEDPRFSHRLDQHLGTHTRAMMATPLLTPDHVIGVLEVASWQPSIYTSDDLRTLQSVASTLAAALVNAHLYAEQMRLLQEQERAQLQLIHSEKMSALGRLAASIAHEINNPLQAIQGCLTLAEEELEERQRKDKLMRYLGIVGSEIERIATIGRRMREFYRPASDGQRPTDVHSVLESVLELTNKQLQQSDIFLEQHWASGLPSVRANPDHLRQVFLNLVLNAIDAMPDGGTLSISTSRDTMPAHGRRTRRQTRVSYVEAVRIDLSDTGTGMSPETQSRLFEPFFTSKEHGSGLGLSVSYGIVESHNGQIRVESQEGEGTTFTILLAAASDQAGEP